MSVTIPYSSIATNNLIPATAANFPSLKHFWPCNQSEIGLGFLTDSIAGVKLNKSTGTIAAPASPDGFSVYPNQANSGTTVTGTLYTPTADTNSIILFGVMKSTSGTLTVGFILGDSVNGNAATLASAGTASFTDGTNNVACTAFTGTTQSVIYGRALAMHTWNDATASASHGIQSFEANTTTLGTALSRLTSVATVSAFNPTHFTSWGASNGWACTTAITNLYGYAMFSFTAARTPAEILDAVTWMTYQWSIGNKVIYPGWKGVS